MKPDTTKKRAQILACLTEGMSVRATARVTGASTTTVLRVVANCGEACAAYQDKHLRNLPWYLDINGTPPEETEGRD